MGHNHRQMHFLSSRQEKCSTCEKGLKLVYFHTKNRSKQMHSYDQPVITRQFKTLYYLHFFFFYSLNINITHNWGVWHLHWSSFHFNLAPSHSLIGPRTRVGAISLLARVDEHGEISATPLEDLCTHMHFLSEFWLFLNLKKSSLTQLQHERSRLGCGHPVWWGSPSTRASSLCGLHHSEPRGSRKHN